jgi:hypothetical protein
MPREGRTYAAAMTPLPGEGPPLHPELAGLAFLLGTWRGEGEGGYPTIAGFRYGEELIVGHVGKPFLSWVQRTWSTGDGRPLHSEMGYLRPGRAEAVELVMAHPTGVVELSEGTRVGTKLELHSRHVNSTSTAKPVIAIGRHLTVDGDEMRYRLSMAAVGQAQAEHLVATLYRRHPEKKGDR